jgi:hypothetical protein
MNREPDAVDHAANDALTEATAWMDAVERGTEAQRLAAEARAMGAIARYRALKFARDGEVR